MLTCVDSTLCREIITFNLFPWYWMRILKWSLIFWAWRCEIDCQNLLESLMLVMCQPNKPGLDLALVTHHFIWSWTVVMLYVGCRFFLRGFTIYSTVVSPNIDCQIGLQIGVMLIFAIFALSCDRESVVTC